MADGFSHDGYIIDQDQFSAYRYRGMASNINGCGWVAAYDLLRAQGLDVDWHDVHRQMDAMFPLKIPGPTPLRILRRYLAQFGAYRLHRGRQRALLAALSAPAGILRYWEPEGPHFVPFIRQGDVFRFLNVADGLEDYTCSMDAFIRTRCAPRHAVFAITPVDTK